MQVNSAYSNVYAQQTQSVAPSSYNPYGNTVVSDDSGSGSGFSTDFSSISSIAAHAGGGGFAAYKLGGQMNGNMKSIFGNGFKGAFGGIKNTAITGIKGAGLGALVSAGVSAVGNGVGVATGKVDSSEAVSNVIKDSIGGLAAGALGTTAGGLASFIPVKGVVGTVLVTAAGAAGGVAGGMLANKLTEGM